MSARGSTFVRTLAALALLLALAACGGKQEEAAEAPPPPSQHFISRPDLRPPPVHIVTPAHDTAPGYIFIAPKKKVDQAGPMIVDDAGKVVWFRPLDTHGVTDFRAQRYRGRPVLTWWRGETAKGIGNGRYVIADELVPRDRERHRGPRPLRGHPRVHHHAARHRALHRVPPRALRPLGNGRPQGRRDPGRRRAGGRHRDRPRPVRMAQPAARRRRRVVRARPEGRRRAVRLLPHQRDRARPRRDAADLGPAHARDLQDPPQRRRGRLEARRQEERLPARIPARASRGSTTFAGRPTGR